MFVDAYFFLSVITVISPGTPNLKGMKPPKPVLTWMARVPSWYMPPHSLYIREAGDQPKRANWVAWV